MSWIANHYIEVFAAIAGLIYIFLEIRQSIWLWPVGLITSGVYVWVFFNTKFYADMGLQIYYVFISIYGWHWWLKGRDGDKSDILQVTGINRKTTIRLILLFLAIFLFLWLILRCYTDSPLPLGDSFTTAISVIATWMLARKIIEHWLLWIIADIVSVALYIYKGMYPTAILFIVYTLMAIVGYLEWKKDLNTGKNLNFVKS